MIYVVVWDVADYVDQQICFDIFLENVQPVAHNSIILVQIANIHLDHHVDNLQNVANVYHQVFTGKYHVEWHLPHVEEAHQEHKQIPTDGEVRVGEQHGGVLVVDLLLLLGLDQRELDFLVVVFEYF